MDICFWVTDRCNLRCSYCYVTKNGMDMSMETADRSVDFVLPFLRKDLKNTVRFHGGEPLLNPDVIEYIIHKIRKKLPEKSIRYYLTTNGTIHEDRPFLIRNVEITVSLDGAPSFNDANRFRPDRTGTFKEADRFLQSMLQNGRRCSIRMTVHPANVEAFYKNFMFLFSRYHILPGFAPDSGSGEWQEEKITIMMSELEKIFIWLFEQERQKGTELLMNLENEYLSRRSSCLGGKSGLHISVNGDLYPCFRSVNNTRYRIGDVYRGIGEESVDHIYRQSICRNPICKGCALEYNCKSRSCKIINEISTGDPFMPSDFLCTYSRSIYRLITDMEEVLSDAPNEKTPE